MISQKIKDLLANKTSSVIRKMFEEGSILKQKYGEENVFDFSLGNPDLIPPKNVLEAIKEVALDINHGYMQNAGYDFAREAMAKKTSSEQGVEVFAKNIVMSNGAAGAINVTFKSILNAGEEVIVPSPYFAEYNHYVNNHNGKLVAVKTNEDFSLDCAAIENAFTKNTKAILINSPNNPTGKIYSNEEIQNLSHTLNGYYKKYGKELYLICDEPYRDITYNGKKVSPVFQFYDNAIIVTSFAKNISLPGERIGYIAINPKSKYADDFISAAIFSTRILGFVNAPAFFQKVIAKSWNEKCDYSQYEKRCNLLKSIMDDVGLKYAEPEGAFYLFVKVPEKWNGDDMAFVNHLKLYNVLCAPGIGFGGAGWIRIAYCVSENIIAKSKSAFEKAMKN